ncbi:MAG: hypothetical protein AAF968_15805 [Pseudomonadota bacterium]
MTDHIPEVSRLLLNPTTTTIVVCSPQRSDAVNQTIKRAARALQECASITESPFLACVVAANADEATPARSGVGETIVLPSAESDPWRDTRLAELLGDANRDQLVLVGDLSESMMTFLAIGALGKGLDVFLVVEADALSDRSPVAELRLKRLQQFGVVAIDARQAIIELMRDWRDPEGQVSARSVLGKAGL